jgi:hypothetical protein
MTFQKSIIVVFFFISCNSLFAQNKQRNDLDRLYAPPMMLTAGSTETESVNGGLFPNTIKFNPTMLPLGHIALFYERYLFDDVLSIGVGLGISPYKNALMGGLLRIGYLIDISNKNELSIYDIYQNAELVNKFNNIFLSGYAKIHYEAFLLDLGYVEMGFRYSKTNLLLRNSSETPLDKNSYQTYISNSTYHLLWGETIRTDGKKVNTYHDFYIGIGVGMSYFEKFRKDSSYSSTNDNFTRVSGREKKLDFDWRIGYVFGIGFK